MVSRYAASPRARPAPYLVRVIEVVTYSRRGFTKCKFGAMRGGELARLLSTRPNHAAGFEQDDVVAPGVGGLAADDRSDQLHAVAVLQSRKPALRAGGGVTDDVGRESVFVPTPLLLGALVQFVDGERGASRYLKPYGQRAVFRL